MAMFSVEGVINLMTDEAEKALKTTGQNAEKTASGIEQRFSRVGSVMKKALTVTAFVAVGKAIVNLANETARYGDQVDKASQKLGISRKAYQEWSYILSQNGTDVSNLTTAMRTLTTTMSSGSTKTRDALKKIGIGFNDIKKLAPEDQFMSIVQGLAGMENQQERNALAATLFGRSYQELLPLLNSGAESIEELRQKAHELGIVMDDETIDAAVNFTDSLDSLKRTWNSFKMTIGAQMLKPLTRAFETLTKWTSKLIPSLKQGFADNDWDAFFADLTDIMAEALPKAVDTLIGVVNGVLSNAGNIAKLAGTLISGLVRGIGQAVPQLISALPTILGELWTAISESIPDAIHGALTGIWQSVAGWLGLSDEDKNAIEGIFDDAFSGVRAVIGSVQSLFSSIWGNIWKALNDDSLSTGEKIEGMFRAIFGEDGVGGIISSLVATADNIMFDIAEALELSDVYETISGVFNTAFQGAWDVFDSVVNLFGTLFDSIGELFNGDIKLSDFIGKIFGKPGRDGQKGTGLFGVVDSVAQSFSGIFDKILEAMGVSEQTRQQIVGAFDWIVDAAEHAAAAAVDAVGTVVKIAEIALDPDLDSNQKLLAIGDAILGNPQTYIDNRPSDAPGHGEAWGMQPEHTTEATEFTYTLGKAFDLLSIGGGYEPFYDPETDSYKIRYVQGGQDLALGMQHRAEAFWDWATYSSRIIAEMPPEVKAQVIDRPAEDRRSNGWNWILDAFSGWNWGVSNEQYAAMRFDANARRRAGTPQGPVFGEGYTAPVVDGSTPIYNWRNFVDTTSPEFYDLARDYAYANANASRKGIGVDVAANRAAEKAAQQAMLDWFMSTGGMSETEAQTAFKGFKGSYQGTVTDWLNSSHMYRYQLPFEQVFTDDWFAKPAQDASDQLQTTLENGQYSADVTLNPDFSKLIGSGLNPIPGHATGMDYVPFDNYVSRLHRGEAVLSAFEAAEWRSRGQLGAGGNNSSYTDNNTLYVGQMYMSNDLDAEQLQQTLATVTRRRNRGYGLA